MLDAYTNAKDLLGRINEVNKDLVLLTFLLWVNFTSGAFTAILDETGWIFTFMIMGYSINQITTFKIAAETNYKVSTFVKDDNVLFVSTSDTVR
jgi:hypothetical protein